MRRFNQYCSMAGTCGTDNITGVEVLGFRRVFGSRPNEYFQEKHLQLVFTNERGFSQPLYVGSEEARRLLATVSLGSHINPLEVFTGVMNDPCTAPDTRRPSKKVTNWLLGVTLPKNYAICPVSAFSTLDGDTFATRLTSKEFAQGLEKIKSTLFVDIDAESLNVSTR